MIKRFYVITALPEIFDSFCAVGLIGKAVEAGHLAIQPISPRMFATDRHRTIDDAPYGGGSGMVMMPGPMLQTLEHIESLDSVRPLRVLMSPQGRVFDQSLARDLAQNEAITLVCPRYEGIDERAREKCDLEISVGDYVVMGGEVPAMAVIEAVGRLAPHVLGNPESLVDESHSHGRLEYPQYTRPATFRGQSVPPTLISGHHAEVAKWRRRESLRRTWLRRRDLLDRFPPNAEEQKWLAEWDAERPSDEPEPEP